MGHLQRGKAGGLDRSKIPAACLYMQYVLRFTEDVGVAGFDRGVTATVKHEARVTPQQTGRVNAECQVIRAARGLRFIPEVVHAWVGLREAPQWVVVTTARG